MRINDIQWQEILYYFVNRDGTKIPGIKSHRGYCPIMSHKLPDCNFILVTYTAVGSAKYGQLIAK